jgi:CubicO group peptidase (beta-lactamase class C family)
MDHAIEAALAEHALPGAVLWVESKQGLYHRAFGHRSLLPVTEPMTLDTIFDVASLTKVIATTPAIMVLCDRHKVNLHQPVSAYISEFTGHGNETITLRHLLTHTSGLKRTLNPDPDWFDYDQAFAALCREQPSSEPGSQFCYSDLNFILLAEVVHRVSGQPLDRFCSAEIFHPLQMLDTGFRPAPSQLSRVAPTEKIGDQVLRGTVHDPKAQAMDGIAGHAGLFTTAPDLARFARMILNGGQLDGVRILRPETVRLMTTTQTPPTLKVRRGLGWDIDSDFSHPRGELFPIGSFGHTGFTGVCLWIDPDSKSFWLLLSNRIHPDVDGDLRPLQRQLGTLAAQALHLTTKDPTPHLRTDQR